MENVISESSLRGIYERHYQVDQSPGFIQGDQYPPNPLSLFHCVYFLNGFRWEAFGKLANGRSPHCRSFVAVVPHTTKSSNTPPKKKGNREVGPVRKGSRKRDQMQTNRKIEDIWEEKKRERESRGERKGQRRRRRRSFLPIWNENHIHCSVVNMS